MHYRPTSHSMANLSNASSLWPTDSQRELHSLNTPRAQMLLRLSLNQTVWTYREELSRLSSQAKSLVAMPEDQDLHQANLACHQPFSVETLASTRKNRQFVTSSANAALLTRFVSQWVKMVVHVVSVTLNLLTQRVPRRQ